MPLIKWDDSLSVNIVEFDRQHQKLIGLINELNDGMHGGKGKDILEKIINELVRYADTHFKTEEKYFEQFAYPQAYSHKKEHLAFVEKVSRFKGRFEKGELALSVEVMQFLSDWLQNHIKGIDKKYIPFFKGKGME